MKNTAGPSAAPENDCLTQRLDQKIGQMLLKKDNEVYAMHNEFTAIVEQGCEWFIAYCPEIPGAYGQGRTKDECLKNLSEAIDLILEDRREDALRGIPADAMREMVSVG
jgi:predicted RNase H-like HicB family nuclease